VKRATSAPLIKTVTSIRAPAARVADERVQAGVERDASSMRVCTIRVKVDDQLLLAVDNDLPHQGQ